MAYQNLGGQLSYWRTPSGSEIDFIWTRGKRAVGIEVKAARTWRREDGTALKTLLAGGALAEVHGAYTGAAPLRDGPIHVWPLTAFLRELAAGNLIG